MWMFSLIIKAGICFVVVEMSWVLFISGVNEKKEGGNLCAKKGSSCYCEKRNGREEKGEKEKHIETFLFVCIFG